MPLLFPDDDDEEEDEEESRDEGEDDMFAAPVQKEPVQDASTVRGDNDNEQMLVLYTLYK